MHFFRMSVPLSSGNKTRINRLPRKALPWKRAKVCLQGLKFQNLDHLLLQSNSFISNKIFLKSFLLLFNRKLCLKDVIKDLATPHKKRQATQKKCTCDDKGLEETREILKWYNLGATYIINLSNVRITL